MTAKRTISVILAVILSLDACANPVTEQCDHLIPEKQPEIIVEAALM
jgi:hypothetical protein